MEINQEINCAEDCVNGCVLGDQCPKLQYSEAAAKFIDATPLDKMLEMADAAVRRRMMERAMEPPKWVLPED